MVPITTIVRNYLYKNNIKLASVAAFIPDNPSNFSRKLKRNNIDVDYVTRICSFCQHDFFADYMAQFKNDLGGIVNDEPQEYQNEKVSRTEYDFILKENIGLYRKLEACRTRLEELKKRST